MGAGMLIVASTAAGAEFQPVFDGDSSEPRIRPRGARRPTRPQMNLAAASWIHMPTPPPREIQKHDIISVRVDILARMASEGELRRRKNGLYDARLNDWIIFDGLRWVKPSPQTQGDPRVRGELRSQYRSLGELETAESLAFNLATEVVDIRPNGNLVLEGRTNSQDQR